MIGLGTLSFAQSVTIVDAINAQPIAGVQLYEEGKLLATSNAQGVLSVEDVISGFTYHLELAGYKKRFIDSNQLLSSVEISLSRKRENLPEIVINSGNNINFADNDLRNRPQSVS